MESKALMLCACFQIFRCSLWLCLCLHVALRCLSTGAAKALVADVADRRGTCRRHRSGPTQLCRSVPHSWPDVKETMKFAVVRWCLWLLFMVKQSRVY